MSEESAGTGPAWGTPEPSGDTRVDEALTRLGELPGTPVAGHVEVFEDVHRRLQDVLQEEDAPGEDAE